MSTDAVEELWRGLVRSRNQAKKYFDTSHPLALLYGSDTHGAAMFVVITDAEPPLPQVSRDVRTDVRRRDSDGRWVLTMTLTDMGLFSPFVRLCTDLVARSRPGESPDEAMRILLEVLDEWKLLLRPFRPARLTLEELRGLVAELWFGYNVLTRSRSGDQVTQAWTGPLGAPQDFTFLDAKLVEVKSRRPGSDAVRISSAKQLDPLGKELTLAVVVLDDCDRSVAGAITLLDVVEHIRTGARLSPAERNHFDDLLMTQGADLEDPYYAETWFRPLSHESYQVGDSFPSIRASELHHSLDRVEYVIHTSSLSEYLIASTSLAAPEENE